MKTLKIMIFGISGDYARRKIIPSIAQFHNHYKDKVAIEIIGYSRSRIAIDEITSIISEHTDSEIQITLVTGEYTDTTYFTNQLNTLKPDEKLICYLALPPSVYLQFLEQVCLISSKDYTILIEKPFGRNKKESEQILQTIMGCHLYHNIFFVDHYLFKPSSRLPLSHIFSRYGLQFDDVHTVSVHALESLGVEGRIGYYDQTGALKDMFAHLYSLYMLVMKELKVVNSPSSWSITSFDTKQYDGYIDDLKAENTGFQSDTETYFNLQTTAYYPNKTIPISFESGKKQPQKETYITLHFTHHKAVLSFAPESSFTLYKGDDIIASVPVLDTFYGDHERMFKDVLENNFAYFIRADEIAEYWNVIEKIK